MAFLDKILGVLPTKKAIQQHNIKRGYVGQGSLLTSAERQSTILTSYKNIIASDVDYRLFKVGLGKQTLLPDWYLWEKWYYIFDPIPRAVNKITNNTLTTGWVYRDFNGKPCQKLTDFINEKFDYHTLIPRWFTQILVHGTAINAIIKMENNKDQPFRFEIISPAETYNHYYNINLGKITKFSWRNDVVETNAVDLFDASRNQNYYLSKRHSLSSMTYGDSYIQPFFLKIDTFLQDSDNYRLFLENNSYPGMLVMFDPTNIENPDETINVLEANLQAWKSKQKRHSASVLTIPPKDIKIEQIKQDLENRMSPKEKEMIEMDIQRALQIPLIRAGYGGEGGMNSGKGHEVQQMNFDTDIFKPTAILCQKDWRVWYDPFVLDYAEKQKFFEKNKIMVIDAETKEERIATKDDFYFCMGSLPVELLSSRRERGIQEVQNGIKSPADYKRQELGLSDKDIHKSDEMKMIPNNVTLALPDNMIEGNARRGGITGDELTNADGEVVGTRIRVKGDKDIDVIDNQTDGTNNEIIENQEAKVDQTKLPAEIKAIDFGLDKKDFRQINIETKKQQLKFLENLSKDSSQIEELLKTDIFKDFETTIKEEIVKLYKNIDFKSILAKVEPLVKELKKELQQANSETIFEIENSTKSSPEIEALKKVIAEEIKKQIGNIDLNQEKIIDILIFVALLAIKDAERQAVEAGVNTIPLNEKPEMERKLKEFLNARLNALSGQTIEYNPEQEYLKFETVKSLDETSEKFLNEIILFAILQSAERGQPAEEIIQEEIIRRGEQRASVISNTELALVYTIGLSLAGDMMKAPAKEWLLSTAIDKRDAHLKNVGKIIPFNDYFVAGDGVKEFSPGRRINCKCGMRLIFDASKIKKQ